MVCFRCGRDGHFANQCYSKKRSYDDYISSSSSSEDGEEDEVQCYRCGQLGHYANTCFGRPRTEITCYRCGAKGHYANVCIARPAARVQSGAREGVYVLKAHNFYYVGKSSDIDARILEHRRGDMGAACLIDRGEFEEILPVTSGPKDDHESWERNETLQRMRMHGIENVRGWMFTSAELSRSDKQNAFRQMCEKFDLCRRCGKEGHFAEECR